LVNAKTSVRESVNDLAPVYIVLVSFESIPIKIRTIHIHQSIVTEEFCERIAKLAKPEGFLQGYLIRQEFEATLA